MRLTDKEKKLLRALLRSELKMFRAEEKRVPRPNVAFLAAEEKYETFLKSLVKKLSPDKKATKKSKIVKKAKKKVKKKVKKKK